jgi:hypothetical protein
LKGGQRGNLFYEKWRSAKTTINFSIKEKLMALKPGPKPIAKSTGKVDKRRRDNKDTQGNNPDLKPSKSSKK